MKLLSRHLPSIHKIGFAVISFYNETLFFLTKYIVNLATDYRQKYVDCSELAAADNDSEKRIKKRK